MAVEGILALHDFANSLKVIPKTQSITINLVQDIFQVSKGWRWSGNISKRSHFSQPVEFPNRYHLIHAPFLEDVSLCL